MSGFQSRFARDPCRRLPTSRTRLIPVALPFAPVSATNGPVAPEPQTSAFGYPKILLIRPRKIGDVVLCTALFRALRQAYPTAHITFLTQIACAELMQGQPYLDQVLVYPESGSQGAYLGLARRLRRERFDVVIDLFSSPTTARLTRLTGAARRIGYRLRGRTWAYTDTVVPLREPHYMVHDLGGLLRPLGVRLQRSDPELAITAERRSGAKERMARLGVRAEDMVVALVPGAEETAKRWPVARYAAVADWMIETLGVKVLLLYGPGEAETVLAVRRAMRHQALPPVPPVAHLSDLAALLEQCGLYLGADVGTRHMSIAVGTPTVTIFGRAHVACWSPPGSARHVALGHDPGCKTACTFPRCATLACIQEIPQAWVKDAVLSLLPVLRARFPWIEAGAIQPWILPKLA
jgi:ADP-heptose:LPS heptosyltransferase